MKRFKVNFPIDGKEEALIVEAMDSQCNRYSVERTDNDPNPLLLICDHDRWIAESSDTSWSLDEEHIHELGCKIATEFDHSECDFTGINAK